MANGISRSWRLTSIGEKLKFTRIPEATEGKDEETD